MAQMQRDCIAYINDLNENVYNRSRLEHSEHFALLSTLL